MFFVSFSFAGNQGPSQAQFEAQAAAGLNVQLEYVDASTIKCSSKSGATIDVITPDLKIVSVSTSGITKTVAGSTSTFYYVYLDSAGIVFSTTAPDTSYTNMKTLTSNKLLLGYMGCSGSNAIAGTHNVYSFWNEPQRNYQGTFSSLPYTFSLAGTVIPPGVSASISFSGTVQGQTTLNFNGRAATAVAINTSIGTVNASGSNSNAMCDVYPESWTYGTVYTYRTQSVSLSTSSLSSGIYTSLSTCSTTSSYSYNNYISESCYARPYPTVSYNGYTSVSGTLTLTRPGS